MSAVIVNVTIAPRDPSHDADPAIASELRAALAASSGIELLPAEPGDDPFMARMIIEAGSLGSGLQQAADAYGKAMPL